jgi:glucose-1-phosphate thymidylyltransferase
LLENGHNNSEAAAGRKNVVVIPPVYIHQSAQIENSVIGPHASIGAEAQVRSSIIRNSILEDEAEVTDVILESSLIGRRACIQRRAGMVNAGDNTILSL